VFKYAAIDKPIKTPALVCIRAGVNLNTRKLRFPKAERLRRSAEKGKQIAE